MRRASCGLRESAGFRVFVWHARARHCVCCLSGGGAARELAARARRAALVVVYPRTRQGHWTGERTFSVGARPWCDVPAAASENQPAFAWAARARHCACCLSGGGAARELTARVRHSALDVTGPYNRPGHRTGERPFYVGARPWCDVPAAASDNQPALAWPARARHCARCLSGGGAVRELAARTRRAALGMTGPYNRPGHRTGERSSSVGARPWCDVPAAASENQQAFAWHAPARHCARCLSGGGAARKLTARARRAALAVVGPCTIKGHCTGGGPFPVGARPWCDVQAATSKNQLAFAVFREEAQHASLLRARAVPRLLWPIHTHSQATAPARGLPPSASGRGAMCQLRPPRASRLLRGTREHATALAVSGKKAQHASFLRERNMAQDAIELSMLSSDLCRRVASRHYARRDIERKTSLLARQRVGAMSQLCNASTTECLETFAPQNDARCFRPLYANSCRRLVCAPWRQTGTGTVTKTMSPLYRGWRCRRVSCPVRHSAGLGRLERWHHGGVTGKLKGSGGWDRNKEKAGAWRQVAAPSASQEPSAANARPVSPSSLPALHPWQQRFSGGRPSA